MDLNPFVNLSKLFEIIESKGKINLSIINDLDNTINDCIELENYWLSKISENYIFFYIFHSLRNIKLRVNKIKERVLNSHKNVDNPQIAIDALKILPTMSEIFNLALNLKEETPSYSTINDVKKLNRSLCEKSFNLKLQPTIEDELKDVDIKNISNIFIKFTEKIQEGIYDI